MQYHILCEMNDLTYVESGVIMTIAEHLLCSTGPYTSAAIPF